MAEQGVAPSALSTEARPPWLRSDVEPDRYHKQMLESMSTYKRVRAQDIDNYGVERFLGVCAVSLLQNKGLMMLAA
jgi:hypothetical protein